MGSSRSSSVGAPRDRSPPCPSVERWTLASVTCAIAVLAQVPVRIIEERDPGPTTYDWLVFAASAAAAIGTLVAIGVALFVPAWRAKRRKPALSIEAVERRAQVPSERAGYTPVDAFHLVLHNNRGRDTAHAVEVFLTASAHRPDRKTLDTPGDLPAFQHNLNFDNPLQGQYGSRDASVPSGFYRRIHLAVLGNEEAIFNAHYEAVPRNRKRKPGPRSNAAFSLYPARNDTIAYLKPGVLYDVELVIVGANFDAVAYAGALRYHDIEDPSDRRATIEWVTEPRPQSRPSLRSQRREIVGLDPSA